jgi:peptide/nickel transport system substrate-binding protein
VSDRRVRRRDLLKLGAATGAVAMLTACLPQGTEPAATTGPATQTPATAGKFPLGKLEGGEVITDPAKFPKTFRDAPDVAALVQQGKLPPVAERIGQDPLVIKPVHATGKYGGVMRKAFIGTSDGTAFRFAAGPDSLLYWDWQWSRLLPNVARSFDLSADGKVLTIQLRRGMRWSDGAPFTADDVMFWYEDMYRNKDLVATPSAELLINGKAVVIERVDQLTVRFVSPDPNYLLPQRLAAGGDLGGQSSAGDRALGLIAPKHYLSKLHPKYAPKAELDRLVAEGKFSGWATFFKTKNNWLLNPDLPVLTPWRTTRPMSDPSLFVLERNPYSIWVDTEGNQLPYIGRIEHAFAQDPEVVALRAVAGEYDFQDRLFDVSKLPVLIEGQQRAGYKIHLDPEQGGLGINLNLAYEADPEIGELIRTVDFRRALSMGIDRDQINETFFLGTGTPGASVPADDNKYSPGREWRTKWATLDVAQANQLLDKIGLTRKDADGYRLRKDGARRVQLEFLALNRLADFPQVAEVIKRQWRAIGIDLVLQTANVTLALERIGANAAQMVGNNTGSEDVFLNADTVLPGGRGFSAILGAPYAAWMRTEGRQGKEPFPALRQLMELWARGFAAPEKERIEIGKEVVRMHVDQVFTIGLIGQGLTSYGVRYAKTTLGNVPGRIVNGIGIRTSLNALPMTFFFK